MLDRELKNIKKNYEDYIKFEGGIHGGRGTGLINTYSYKDGHDNFCEWLIDGFSYLIEEIEKPREQNKWIPVTERLPKEENNYLVTYGNEKIMTHHFNGYCFINTEWINANKGIKAWSELPQPYKEGNNEHRI